MAKKLLKKKITSKKSSQNIVVFKYIYIGFVALVIVFAGKATLSAVTKVHVLGASTGSVLLADQGSDGGSGGGGDSGSSGGSGGSSGSGDSGSVSSSGTSGSGSSTSGTSGSGSNIPVANSGSVNSPISGSTQVDCVGPDGKHFTTEFHDCQELNQKWGKSNFTFTQLNGSTQTDGNNSLSGSDKGSDHNSGKLEVQTEGNKGEFNLETPNSHIEIKQEDNGQVSIHAQQKDGTEVTLKDNSLEDINKLMEDQGVEVSSDSANGLSLISGGVHATTNFPLSFDPTTKTLSITTPNGTKAIAVLPDQAVSAVLQSGIMTHVQSQNLGDQAATATANLTELNNQAVFEINGVAEKKLLGLFPVGFAKTTFVSATNGDVVQTNESLFNKLLEAISF